MRRREDVQAARRRELARQGGERAASEWIRRGMPASSRPSNPFKANTLRAVGWRQGFRQTVAAWRRLHGR